MKIRSRLLLSIIPPVVAIFLLSMALNYAISSTGLLQLKNDSLQFKAQLIRNHIDSQWNLLVDFQLFEDVKFIESAQESIAGFATSILQSTNDCEVSLLDGESTDDRSKDDAATNSRFFGGTDSEEPCNNSELFFSTTTIDNQQNQEQDLVVVIWTTDSSIVLTQDELQRLQRQFDPSDPTQSNFDILRTEIDGEEYVYTSFYYPQFDWTIYVAEQISAFNASSQIILQISVIIIVCATLLFLLIIYQISRTLTKPLHSMVKQSDSIFTDSMNIDISMPYEYKDEVGNLALTFNSVFSELNATYDDLKEHAVESALAQNRERKIRTVFQKYVPQELIDRYITKPESLLEGEQRHVAVLFSDIRQFSSLSENMDPASLVRFLNRYLNKIIDIIHNQEGVVDKFIGDSVMALFGAPILHTDDAKRSIQVALEMLKVVNELNIEASEDGVPAFRIGIGIHIGDVVVGNIGNNRKIEYTAIGDAVNLASRLEGLCKRYQLELVFSRSIAEHIKNDYTIRYVDRIIAKGKTKSTQIYSIAPNVSMVALKQYHNAIRLFYRKEFEQSRKMFMQAKTNGLDDYLTDLYIRRSRTLSHVQLPDQWDGVIRMETK